MKYLKCDYGYLICLEIGEEIVASLNEFANKFDIRFAQVFAIGASNDVILGSFNPIKKVYQEQHFKKDFEICNLTGNITMVNDKPFLHAHVSLADDCFNSFGGHLNQAIVSATCEIMLYCSNQEVKRVYNNDTKLYVLDLDSEKT